MKLKNFKTEVEIPDGVEVEVNNTLIKVKGPKGEILKEMKSKKIKIESIDKKVMITIPILTKKEKKVVFTFKAHIINMIRGVTESHIYKLKICSGHFPMNVALNNNELVVKNFLGEKVPRISKYGDKVNVKLDGDIITIESPDKELAGQTAANFEQLTRITNRDRRIFQDGIYITHKSGKDLE